MKTFKNNKVEHTIHSFDDFNLNENIVVGNYYSSQEQERRLLNINYAVNDFPINFKTLPVGSLDHYSDYYNFGLEDSSNEYKVSGKKWAKADFSYEKDEELDIDDFFLAPYKIKNYHDYITQRLTYEGYGSEDSGYQFFTENPIHFNSIKAKLAENYKDTNKGKVSPAIKKFYKKEIGQYYGVSNALKYNVNDLYNIALMNLIIQIFGIIFWAIGKFLPTDDNEERAQSDENPINGQNDQNEEKSAKEQSDENSSRDKSDENTADNQNDQTEEKTENDQSDEKNTNDQQEQSDEQTENTESNQREKIVEA